MLAAFLGDLDFCLFLPDQRLGQSEVALQLPAAFFELRSLTVNLPLQVGPLGVHLCFGRYVYISTACSRFVFLFPGF